MNQPQEPVRVSTIDLPQQIRDKIAQDLGISNPARIPKKLIITGIPEAAAKQLGMGSHPTEATAAIHVA